MPFTPVSPVVAFGNSRPDLSRNLTRFRDDLFQTLDRASGYSVNDATAVRTMTRRFGIASIAGTDREITVTLAEKADSAKKDAVRAAVETMSAKSTGKYRGKTVKVIERPCPYLELGGHQSWSGLK